MKITKIELKFLYISGVTSTKIISVNSDKDDMQILKDILMRINISIPVQGSKGTFLIENDCLINLHHVCEVSARIVTDSAIN